MFVVDKAYLPTENYLSKPEKEIKCVDEAFYQWKGYKLVLKHRTAVIKGELLTCIQICLKVIQHQWVKHII